MREIRFVDDSLVGEAYTPLDDAWYSFAVDMKSGNVTGGSYNGPDM
jgi:hypothetical protein